MFCNTNPGVGQRRSVPGTTKPGATQKPALNSNETGALGQSRFDLHVLRQTQPGFFRPPSQDAAVLFAGQHVALPACLTDHPRRIPNLDGQELRPALERLDLQRPDRTRTAPAGMGVGRDAVLHLPAFGDERLGAEQFGDRPDLQVAAPLGSFHELEALDP